MDKIRKLVPKRLFETLTHPPMRVLAVAALHPPFTSIINARNSREREKQSPSDTQGFFVLYDLREAHDIMVVQKIHKRGVHINSFHAEFSSQSKVKLEEIFQLDAVNDGRMQFGICGSMRLFFVYDFCARI